MHASIDTPSRWVARWAPLVARGPVLDVASGQGRHARLFAARGLEVVAVDRDAQSIPGVRFVKADLEDGSPWPFAGQRFGGVVVTNYLHRPLFPFLATALKPSGILIYETFGVGNERFGKPSNPDFLLLPGELLELATAHRLQVLAYACGEVAEPKRAVTQRMVAQRLK